MKIEPSTVEKHIPEPRSSRHVSMFVEGKASDFASL